MGGDRRGQISILDRNEVVKSQFFIFTPILGEMIQFDSYFSNGLKPPTRKQLMDFGSILDGICSLSEV